MKINSCLKKNASAGKFASYDDLFSGTVKRCYSAILGEIMSIFLNFKMNEKVKYVFVFLQ